MSDKLLQDAKTEEDDFQKINWSDFHILKPGDPKILIGINEIENFLSKYPNSKRPLPTLQLRLLKKKLAESPILLEQNMQKSEKVFVKVEPTISSVKVEPTISSVKVGPTISSVKGGPTISSVEKVLLNVKPKQCGLNLYSKTCQENVSFGQSVCQYKDDKCQPITGSDIVKERDILMKSIIDGIDQITNDDLLSLMNIPETKAEYEKYIMNNNKIELEFKIAIISQYISRLKSSKILDKSQKYSLKYLEMVQRQLNRKLSEPTKFILESFDEKNVLNKPISPSSISIVSKPTSKTVSVPSAAGPAKRIQLLHDGNKNFSCYVNSSLFALFHKKNNPLIQMIQKSIVKENIVFINTKNSSCNNTNLKELIIQYYQKIHGEIQTKFPTDKIRQFLANCLYETTSPVPRMYSPNYWTGEQQDNNEFIRQIIQKFNFKKINNGYQLLEETIYKDPAIPNTKDTHSYDRINEDDEIPIYNWPVSYKKTLDIEVDSEKIPDGFTIKEIPEQLTIDNYAKFNADDGSPLIYKNRQINNIFVHPNMLLIFINRTLANFNTKKQIYEYYKTNDPVSIPFQIYNLYLYSIVIHIGQSINTGHYTCYFKNEDNWYLMDDTQPTIEKVDITNPSIFNNISQNCTTLVYYPM